MRKINNRATLLKKRVKTIQGRAKVAGVLYLLGTAAMLALAAVLPVLTGTCITPSEGMPVLSCYQPFVALLSGGMAAWTAETIIDGLTSLLYMAMLLAMVIDLLRAIGKLNWLFKRRASYTNGFNRNMYAMDAMANRFSGAFASLVNVSLFIYILTDGAQIHTNAYLALGVGFAIHFLAGLIGGTVTIFTTGEHIEEEAREQGVFLYFVRNLVQIAAVAAIVYFFIQESTLGGVLGGLLQGLIVNKEIPSTQTLMELIPQATELAAWIFIFVLSKHATAETEFNRDGMYGAGIHNFAVFAFLTFLAVGALAVFPYVGIGAADGTLNVNIVIAAAVAFVGFLLDCILRPRSKKDNDDVEMDGYFEQTEYNNTII